MMAVEAAGLVFPAGAIDWIRARIDADPHLGRTALSRAVCEDLGFRDARGELREMACRVALLELERRQRIELPPALTGTRTAMPARTTTTYAFNKSRVRCSLKALGEIRLIAVVAADGDRSDLWNEMIAGYHYLGYVPLVGAQIRYLIHSEHYGYLGAIGFAASARRLADRDRFIGWSEQERAQGLQGVVCNSRFLLLPWVEVKNLASHVLARVTRQLPQDWHDRYGYSPVLIETFVDTERFNGTCYRAANWIEVGQTRGRGRQDRANSPNRSIKRIFLYPLVTRWRAALGVRESPISPSTGTDWVEREFGNCDLGDPRRTRRLVTIAHDFYARPQASIPQACNGEIAKVKATYRFMNNPEVTFDKLLDGHRRETITRMAQEKVVLAVQDTTTLNYTAHGCTEGIGPIGARTNAAVGLIVHDTIAVTPAGLVLGVLDAQVWAREFTAAARPRSRAIEEKESIKWLKSYEIAARIQAELKDTRVISVGDRESDIYELFALASAREGGPALLVRANIDRRVEVPLSAAGECVDKGDKGADAEEETKHLWAHLRSQPLAGYRELLVPPRPAKDGKPAQRACKVNLEVRFAPVVLDPPGGKMKLGRIGVYAVYVCEQNPLDPDDPTEWLLLTTVEVKDFDAACEIVDWYTERWMIEVFHRTLKSGCRIEERRHHTAHAIENCLAVDMVIAARILLLTWLGRKCPNLPCSIYFEDNQWKALYCFIKKTPIPPAQEPTMAEMIGWIGKLGGHLGRKCDGPPGTKALWLGLPRVDDIGEFYKVFAKFAEGP